METTLPNMKTAKASHPLAAAVLKQLGGGTEAIQNAIDAGNHGADGGFHGFTYYTDTIAFAVKNHKAIAEAIEDVSEICAVQEVMKFNCLDNPSTRAVAIALYNCDTQQQLKDKDEVDLVLNAMAWFALEKVGHAIESLTD